MEIKNAMIFGDSYSTFKGYIPETHAAYYAPELKEEKGDVNSVEKTWWHKLSTSMGFNIVRNDSWSGSTVCYANDIATGCKYAFYQRLNNLDTDGFFADKNIDTVFIFGGTNDSWRKMPIGEPKYTDFTDDDLRAFAPAFCYLLIRIREICPTARIISIINTELKEEIVEIIKVSSKKLDTHFLELHDILKISGHPTESGMIAIAEQLETFIKSI